MKTFLFISSDPGVTRALIPVVKELNFEKYSIIIGGGEVAKAIWEIETDFDIKYNKFDDDISEEKVKIFLNQIKPDMVIVGAGLYNMIEHTFRRAAMKVGIFCFSMLDFWAGYRSRFQRIVGGRCISSIPDKIGVMDKYCLNEMIVDGFKPENLIIVGAPHLEESVNLVKSFSKNELNEFSSSFGILDENLIFVFFSVSMPGFDGNSISTKKDGSVMPTWGYTQHTILNEIIESLSINCEKHKQNIQLLIKPHPLEPIEPLERTIEKAKISSFLDCKIVITNRAAGLISIADIVLGTTSTALLEASLAGKPSFSIQIGTKEKYSEDIFYGNQVGLTLPIYEKEELNNSFDTIFSEYNLNIPVAKFNFTGSAIRTAKTLIELSQ